MPCLQPEVAHRGPVRIACQILHHAIDDRQWRVRGLEKQLSCERLRVNLLMARRELVPVDTLDLYVTRQRQTFVKQAADELYLEEETVKRVLVPTQQK